MFCDVSHNKEGVRDKKKEEKDIIIVITWFIYVFQIKYLSVHVYTRFI